MRADDCETRNEPDGNPAWPVGAVPANLDWRSGVYDRPSKAHSPLGALTLSETFERLGFVGTQMVLTLFLAERYAVAGPERQLASRLLGHADPVALTAQTMAGFFAAAHIMTFAGAGLAARLGVRRVVLIGLGLICLGQLGLCLGLPLPASLLLLVCGAGCTVSNKLSQVGSLPDPSGKHHAQRFATYAVGLNAGVLLAPLVCGTLGERWGWSWGFGAASASTLMAMLIYASRWRRLGAVQAVEKPAATWATPRGHARGSWLIALTPLVPYVLLLAAVNQAFTLVLVWAADHSDRHLLGFEMPVTWLLFVDGIASIVGLLLAKRLWKRLDAPDSSAELLRVAIGCIGVGAAYLWLAWTSRGAAPTGIAVLFAFYLLLELAMAWVDPPLEAWLSRRAGSGRLGFATASLKASAAIAALLLGWLSRFYLPLGPTGFWYLNALIAGVASLALALIAIRFASVRPRRYRSRS